MSSPGAAANRAQYQEQGCPAATDRVNYGTYQAAVETLLPHREHPEDFSGFATTLPGGFGKPPKEYPWANATATRCDKQGQPNPQGDHVQFHVVSVAGSIHSNCTTRKKNRWVPLVQSEVKFKFSNG